MIRFRLAALVTSLLGLALTPACLELSTTNEGGTGGGGNVGGSENDGGSSTGKTGSSSSSSSASSASSSSGAMPQCDDPANDCAACETCSGQTPIGECTKEYTACQMSAACKSIDDCITACPSGDFACWSNCMSMYPTGANLFNDYYGCMCSQCYKRCPAECD